MTTKPTYTVFEEIDYSSLDFNPDEPEEMPDGMIQNPIIGRIWSIVSALVEANNPPGTVFYSSNTNLCYNRENLNDRVLPDLYLAFDVDVQAIYERKLYLPWEAGKPPDFVLEVGSESTFQNDVGPKRDLYARIGIAEYWLFDPTGGEFYGEPLAGEQLLSGSYQPFDLTTEPDGVLKGYSPALGRSLCWRDGILELYDPETNTYHRDLNQAEARIRELEEEIRRRQA